MPYFYLRAMDQEAYHCGILRLKPPVQRMAQPKIVKSFSPTFLQLYLSARKKSPKPFHNSIFLMHMKQIFGALLAVCFFLSGCDKKEDGIPSPNNECFFSTNLDSTEISNRLLGKWDWQYSFSGWTSQYSDEVNKGLSLEFKSGGVLIVKRNGTVTQTVSWSLRSSNLDLITEPSVIETWGPVYFCNDQLLFQGGVSDGTNNYYKRK